MASRGTPSLSIKHGVRLVPQPNVTVEEVLLAVGELIDHANLEYASRMNKGVIVFVKEERFVNELVASGVYIRDIFVQVNPLYAPSTRVVVSGIPPFIPNELIEQELKRFGKFASPLRAVSLGCKDAKLKHVHSLRRQAYMFLDSPTQELDVSFKVKHDNSHYMIYANAGSMRCFQCGMFGHKRLACPQTQRAEAEAAQAAAEGAAAAAQPPENNDHVVDVNAAGEQPAVELNEHGARETADVAEDENQSVTETDSQVESAAHSADAGVNIGASTSSTTGEGLAVPSNRPSVTVTGGGGDTTSLSNSQSSEMDLEVEEYDESDESEPESENESESKMTKDNTLYSLHEINNFLDETFGKSIKVQNFFPDIGKFIRSVNEHQRTVGTDQLDERRRFRLRKFVTSLKKVEKMSPARRARTRANAPPKK